MDVRWKLQYMFKYNWFFDSCDKQKKIYRMICIEYQLEIAEVSRWMNILQKVCHTCNSDSTPLSLCQFSWKVVGRFELGLALKHAPFLFIFQKTQDYPLSSRPAHHLHKLPKQTVLLQRAGSGDHDPDHLQKLSHCTVLFASAGQGDDNTDHSQKLSSLQPAGSAKVNLNHLQK